MGFGIVEFGKQIDNQQIFPSVVVVVKPMSILTDPRTFYSRSSESGHKPVRVGVVEFQLVAGSALGGKEIRIEIPIKVAHRQATRYRPGPSTHQRTDIRERVGRGAQEDRVLTVGRANHQVQEFVFVDVCPECTDGRLLENQVRGAIAQIKLFTRTIQIEPASRQAIHDQKVKETILVGISENAALDCVSFQVDACLINHIVERSVRGLPIQATEMVDVESPIRVVISQRHVGDKFVRGWVRIQPKELVRESLCLGGGRAPDECEPQDGQGGQRPACTHAGRRMRAKGPA